MSRITLGDILCTLGEIPIPGASGEDITITCDRPLREHETFVYGALLPVTTDNVLLEKLASVNTGSINDAKPQYSPEEIKEAYRKTGVFPSAPPVTGGKTMAELQAAAAAEAEVFKREVAERFKKAVTERRAHVVQEIKVDVVLDAPQESEADRIMRITREMARG